MSREELDKITDQVLDGVDELLEQPLILAILEHDTDDCTKTDCLDCELIDLTDELAFNIETLRHRRLVIETQEIAKAKEAKP